MIRSAVLLTLLTAALPACGAAAASPGSWLIRTWDSDDGLPQNSVVSLAQTADGYLWVGTLLGGLARFDGVRFVRFAPADTPALRDLETHRLFPGADGALWIAQASGALARWRADGFQEAVGGLPQPGRRVNALLCDDGTDALFSLQGGPLLRIRQRSGAAPAAEWITVPGAVGDSAYFCADTAGRVWYRTVQGGLGWWAGGESGTASLPGGRQVLSAMASGPDGSVWLGSGAGIFRLTASGAQDMTPAGEPPGGPADQLAAAADGSVWVRRGGRLRRWQDGKWSAEARGLPDSVTSARTPANLQLLPAGGGGLWILHRHEGVWYVQPDGTTEHPGAQHGLPGGLVECGLVDREGSLWVGFNGGGLARVRPRFFHPLTPPGGPAPVVRSICQDAEGAVWTGQSDGRLLRWHDGVSTERTLPGPLPASGAPAPARDVIAWPARDGTLWIGSVGSGVWTLRGEELERPFAPGDVGTVVRAGLCDRQGRVWMGSESGLYCWADGRLQRFTAAEGFAGRYVLALAEGPDGSLWAGTAEGRLWRWRDGKFESWSLAGAPEFRFWSLLAEADGTVWVGTLAGGLLRWRDGVLRQVTGTDGLPTDTVAQILTDRAGNLWTGSREGILTIPRAGLEALFAGSGGALHCRTFTLSDGLPAMECSGGFHPGCLQAGDGRLWFATVKGAVSVMPGTIPRNLLPPPVLIEELRVNGRPPGDPRPVLAISQAGGEVHLPPGRQSCEFRFTAPSLTAPEKVRFQWRLEGLESAWVDGGTLRTVRYGFLPPGRYAFHVRACNNDGVWNETGARLGLVIAPYYWQTLWFRITAPLAGTGLAVLALWAALRRRHRQQLDVLARRQALQNERARIAQDLHDDLGASLTQLTWLCEAAASPAGGATLPDIGARARGMVRSIDAIVWAVNPRNDTLDQLAHYICQFAEDFLRGTALRCRLDVDEALPVLPVESPVRHDVFLIAREAIHNAARHSGATELRIRIHAVPGGVDIRIADNGCGFRPDEASGGDGLGNMQRRAAAVGATLTLDSRPGHGCCVSLRLPLRP